MTTRVCPLCNHTVNSTWEEIEHMHSYHQDEIDARLAAAGEHAVDEASPLFALARHRLGEKRMHEHVQHNGVVNAMLFFLNQAITLVPAADYSDEALDALRADAEDLVRAATDFRDWTLRLADDWLAQRRHMEGEAN